MQYPLPIWLAIAAWSLLLPMAACQHPAQTGTSAADTAFHLPNTDTLPYPIVERFDDLAPLFRQQNDTLYVINFWATWCGPCVEELPYFEQLATATQGMPVKIVMVSLDFRRDLRTKLLRFVRQRPTLPPVIALADSKTAEWIDRVNSNWSGAIPITIIYRNDRRLFVEDAFADYEQLREAVFSLMQ